MASSATPYTPGMGQHFRDPRELMGLKLISLCVGTLSLVATLIATYHFLCMRRVFRHEGICYVGFPLVSLAAYQNRRIQSGSLFCQFSGFFLTVGIEAADLSALLIALHTVLYIVRPRRQGGGNGLYPYRYWAYTAITLFPLVDASLAFAGGMPGFEDTGAMCFLPLRERWYRTYLTWVPRYIIFCLIVTLYVGLFLFVRFAQWRYAKAHDWSRRSCGTAASATLVSSATSAGSLQKATIQMGDLLPHGSLAITKKNSIVSLSRNMPSAPSRSRQRSHDGVCAQDGATGQASSNATADWHEADQRRKSVKFSPMVWNPEPDSKVVAQTADLSEEPGTVRPDEGAENSLQTASIDRLNQRRMTWNLTDQFQQPPTITPPPRSRLSMSAVVTTETLNQVASQPRTRQPPPFSPLIDISGEQLLSESTKQRLRRATTASMSLHVPSGMMGSTHELGRMTDAEHPSTSALALIRPPTQEADNRQQHQSFDNIMPLPLPLPSTLTTAKTITTDDAPMWRGDAGSESGGTKLAYESGTQVAQTRSRVRKQLIMLFIYPLLYIAMWLVPFLSHVIYFDNHFTTEKGQLPAQPLWVLCLSMTSLSIQGGVNASLFMWRERPWSFRDERGLWRQLNERTRDWIGGGSSGAGGVLTGCWLACLGSQRGQNYRLGGDRGAAPGKSRQEMMNDRSLARIRRKQEMANEATIAASSTKRMDGPRNWWDAEDQD